MTGKNASSDKAIASILKSIYTGFRNKYVFRQNMKIRTYPPTKTHTQSHKHTGNTDNI